MPSPIASTRSPVESPCSEKTFLVSTPTETSTGLNVMSSTPDVEANKTVIENKSNVYNHEEKENIKVTSQQLVNLKCKNLLLSSCCVSACNKYILWSIQLSKRFEAEYKIRGLVFNIRGKNVDACSVCKLLLVLS